MSTSWEPLYRLCVVDNDLVEADCALEVILKSEFEVLIKRKSIISIELWDNSDPENNISKIRMANGDTFYALADPVNVALSLNIDIY